MIALLTIVIAAAALVGFVIGRWSPARPSSFDLPSTDIMAAYRRRRGGRS